MRIQIACILCALSGGCSSSDGGADGGPLGDSAPVLDVPLNDTTLGDVKPRDYTAVDQPLPPERVDCSPAEAAFSEDPCATASVTLDLAAEPKTCALRSGEARMGQPVLTFERQDTACAGHPVVEVIYFAQANSAWQILSVSQGLVEGQDKIREIPGGQLVEAVMRTTTAPETEIAVSFKLTQGGLSVTKVELRR